MHQIMQGLLKYLRVNASVCVIVGAWLVHEPASERDKEYKSNIGCNMGGKTKAEGRLEWRHVLYSAHLCLLARTLCKATLSSV